MTDINLRVPESIDDFFRAAAEFLRSITRDSSSNYTVITPTPEAPEKLEAPKAEPKDIKTEASFELSFDQIHEATNRTSMLPGVETADIKHLISRFTDGKLADLPHEKYMEYLEGLDDLANQA